jgi:deoxyhypusine synthase
MPQHPKPITSRQDDMKVMQLESPIIHAEVDSGMSVDDLVHALGGCGFGAGRLAQACDIYEEMLRDDATTKFFGLAGAMVPAGMRNIVSGLIRDGHIDVLVSTGANLVHDIIESLGLSHYKGSDVADDDALYREQIDRIYDVGYMTCMFRNFTSQAWKSICSASFRIWMTISRFGRCYP